jgi:hypothetical protein
MDRIAANHIHPEGDQMNLLPAHLLLNEITD